MFSKKFAGVPNFRTLLRSIRGHDEYTGIFGSDIFDLQVKEYFGLNAYYDGEYGMIVLNELGMLSNPKRELAFIQYSLSRTTIDPTVCWDSRNLISIIYGSYLGQGFIINEILDTQVRKMFGPKATYDYEDCVIITDGWHETVLDDKEMLFIQHVLGLLSVEFDPDSCRWLMYVKEEEQ